MKIHGRSLGEALHALAQGLLGWEFIAGDAECGDCPEYGISFAGHILIVEAGQRWYGVNFKAFP